MLYTRETRNGLWDSAARLEDLWIRIYEKLSVSVPLSLCVPPSSYLTSRALPVRSRQLNLLIGVGRVERESLEARNLRPQGTLHHGQTAIVPS